MFKICAAILNFGNMKFKQKPRDEQAEVADPAGQYIYRSNSLGFVARFASFLIRKSQMKLIDSLKFA